MSCREILFNPQQVQLGWPGEAVAESRAGDPPAEARLLRIVKPSCPLNIGQRIRFRLFQPLKHPFEVAHELFQMPLQATVGGDYLLVDVIDNLYLIYREAPGPHLRLAVCFTRMPLLVNTSVAPHLGQTISYSRAAPLPSSLLQSLPFGK